MFVCMYASMSVRMRTCLHARTYVMAGWPAGWVGGSVGGWIDGWRDMRVGIHVCMCVQISVCVYIYIRTYVRHASVHTYIHTNTSVYRCAVHMCFLYSRHEALEPQNCNLESLKP